MKIKQFIADHKIATFILLILLNISFFTYRDYGISWDEHAQHIIGAINHKYATGGGIELSNFHDKYYGPAFEVPLIILERISSYSDDKDIFEMRHLLTHLFFLFSCFCGYYLIFRLYKNKYIANIGFLMLALMPIIYAHSFFNTKDIPLMCMYLISFLVAQIAFEKNNLKWFLILGICFGYTTGIRISGCLLLVFVLFFLFIDLIYALLKKEPGKVKSIFFNALVLFASFCTTLYAVWPLLWKAPVKNFISTYKLMSNFVRFDYKVLFNGHIYLATKLPKTYLPTWFAITVPVIWLLIGVVGIVIIIVHISANPKSFLINSVKRNNLFYLMCFFFPWILILYFNSVLYDSWRHLYFIYPAFVLIGCYAINELYKVKFNIAINTLSVIQVAVVAFCMVDSHPFQNVYFNSTINKENENLRKNFELDYWATSLRKGIEFLSKSDTSDKIRLYNEVYPYLFQSNIDFLDKKDRKRFEVLKNENLVRPYYYLTIFRYHPQDYDYKKIVYEIKVQNSTILRIYKVE